MKKLIKLFIPVSIWNYLKSVDAYNYDIKRYIKHSNSFHKLNSQSKIIGKIIYKYHVVEKGLTMPERRSAFGIPLINSLVEDCNLFIQKNYDKSNIHFIHAVKVLNEYLSIHTNSELDPEFIDKINKLSEKSEIRRSSEQHRVSKDEYFENSSASFATFSKSRFSIRNFSGEDVDLKLIYNSIELAQKSPSACNRQPSRVHVISNKELINDIIGIQGGSRGFGHLANKLLILTSDISIFDGLEERNESFFNSGLFTMSLLLSLHYYQIGACSLNWSKEKRQDLQLRKLVNIPENENITMIMACGHVPKELSIATSPRSSYTEITTNHK
jgi:nitroreductase